MKMKKLLSILTAGVLAIGLTACGGGEQKAEEPAAEEPAAEEAAGDTSLDQEILVVSREDGSGTRSAFTELTGVLVEENGEEVDKTLESAQISPSTNEVMTFVSTTEAAIGYISLGSLNDTVKAVKVDGVEATDDEIKAGNYKISRPFNIAYKEANLSDVAKDFVSFIMSKEGQQVVVDDKYIAIDDAAPAYAGAEGLSGNIAIQGSTSVAPLMEKLVEAYNAVQPNVKIEIQANGSSAGVKAAIADQADIGMASRALKDEELAEVQGTAIAQDGIAVIVNSANPVEDLTMEQVRQIFVGELTNWSEI